MSSAIPPTPSHSAGPQIQIQVPRIHVQGPSVHHWPCWAMMLAAFNRMRFSDTRTDVQVLSTTKVRFKLLPRVIPLSCLLAPLFGNFFVLFPGSRHPLPHHPAQGCTPPNPNFCWLGRLRASRVVLQIWGGRCQEREAELSDLRLQRSPYPSPPEAICAP